MSPPTKPAATARAVSSTDDSRVSPLATTIVGWLVPGGGHLLQGQVAKAVTFFGVLILMFAAGILFGGRLFPLAMSEPLVVLASCAEWGLGAPRLVAGLGGFGAGSVAVPTYEYGNTFLIVSGLLNALVVLDAYDLAKGRKAK